MTWSTLRCLSGMKTVISPVVRSSPSHVWSWDLLPGILRNGFSNSSCEKPFLFLPPSFVENLLEIIIFPSRQLLVSSVWGFCWCWWGRAVSVIVWRQLPGESPGWDNVRSGWINKGIVWRHYSLPGLLECNISRRDTSLSSPDIFFVFSIRGSVLQSGFQSYRESNRVYLVFDKH